MSEEINIGMQNVPEPPSVTPNSNEVAPRPLDKESICILIQVIVFLMAVGITVASFTAPSLRNARLRGLATWQWCLLITALLSGPLISKAVVKFILLFIDREFYVMENTIYYVVGLIESAWVVLWFSMILIAWIWVVNEPSFLGVSRINDETMNKLYTTLPFINVTLIGFIIGSFLWLLKQLALLHAKASFHLRRFYTRIRKSLMHQYVIEELSRPLDDEFSDDDGPAKYVNIKGFEEEEREQNSLFRKLMRRKTKPRVVNLSRFDDVKTGKVSCWGMKTLIRGITDRKYLTYKGNEKIDTKVKAAQAAHHIFSSVCSHSESSYIGENELTRYFKNKVTRKQVLKNLREGADSEKIDEDVFKKWMGKAFKYRLALAKALKANRRMFQALNRFVNVMLFLLIVALWLIMLKDKTRKVIFVFGASLVGAAAILGDACKKLLDSLLFVFLVHPFDIGDWCLIGGDLVMIEEINVLSTVILTDENEKRHYSNVELSSKSITNYTRSSHICDHLDFYCDTDTSPEILKMFKSEMTSYLKSESSKFWHPGNENNDASNEEDEDQSEPNSPRWVMEMVQIEGVSKIKMTLQFTHTINYEYFTEKQSRKTLLVEEMNRIIHELQINKKDQ